MRQMYRTVPYDANALRRCRRPIGASTSRKVCEAADSTIKSPGGLVRGAARSLHRVAPCAPHRIGTSVLCRPSSSQARTYHLIT